MKRVNERKRPPIILHLFGAAILLNTSKNCFGAPTEVKKDIKLNYSFTKRILLSTICLLCMSATALAQSQLGADIDGEAAEDSSGSAVSLSADGNRVAIGAPSNDGNGDASGHVRVYQWSNEAWVQLGSDIDGEAVRDTSGRSVSLSSDGNRLAIGANWNDGNGQDSGHVRIYQWTNTAWVQLGDDIDGEATFDESGSAVSLSADGNRVAIGARYNRSNNRQAGHVRVYEWSNTAWVQLGADIDGEAGEDQFGRNLSLSSDGNRVAVGAPYSDANGLNSGQVSVFQWSGAVWTQMGGEINGEAAGARFGESVSLSSDGNRLAIGAIGEFGSSWDRSGHVHIYQWTDTAWVQLGNDIDGETANDALGVSTSWSRNGNRLAVGAIGDDGNGENSGQVRVYYWTNSAWTQLGSDINGEAAGDRSGGSVSCLPMVAG